jgi:hypothetical protein
MGDDRVNDGVGDEQPEDYGTPFSEPDELKSTIPPDHPQTDSNIDLHELYDEGLDGAAEIEEPNKGDNVVGFGEHQDADL